MELIEVVDSNRKMSRKAYGGYKLISVKDPGCPWEGLLWVKAKSLKEFDAMKEEEQNEAIIQKCPKEVPSMCFPADGYALVRSECKDCYDMEGNESGNCPFLFRYANSMDYECRLRERNADERIYSYSD